MPLTSRFGRRIRPSVQAELDAAVTCEAKGEADQAFGHLERAHVLGQAATREHIRVHWAMLRWALRKGEAAEVAGQICRIAAATSKTWLWVPTGNTGGASVGAFRRMPVPPDLQRLIDAART
jgi:hypothetical protein